MVSDSSNILSGSQKQRLTAIQATARVVDDVQLRLATGLSVSKALDDPQNFFSARALNFRASDINRRLDAIGQSIRTIQIAQTGIEADIQLLDQAEAYLLEIRKKIELGELTFGTTPGNAVPGNVTQILPTGSGDFINYAGGQDSGGPVTVTNGGADFDIDGNLWKRLAVNYNVTANTVLEFDYRSTLQPEIASIGFDNDSNFGNNNDRFFIYGSQLGGVNYAAPIPTYQYSGSGNYEHVVIPVGTFFTGNFSHMTFINDSDAAPAGNSQYQNVFLREGPTQPGGTNPTAPPGVKEAYEGIIEQIDLISKDANYRGINLLGSDNLKTIFNETGTSSLITEGIDGTSLGLALNSGSLTSLENISLQIKAIREARNTLRSYSSSLASSFNIIQTRQDFTRNTIDVLRAGRDDLIVGDQNQAGAELLALQVRQQIQSITLAPPDSSIADFL